MISKENYFANASNNIMKNEAYVSSNVKNFKNHFVRQFELRDFEAEAKAKKENQIDYEKRELGMLCKKLDIPTLSRENFVEHMKHMVSNAIFCDKARSLYRSSLSAYQNEMEILCEKATERMKFISKLAKKDKSEAEKAQYEEASSNFVNAKSASLMAKDLLEAYDELPDNEKDIYLFNKFIKNGNVEVDENEKLSFNNFLKNHPYASVQSTPAKTEALEAIISNHEKNKKSKQPSLVVEDFEDMYQEQER